MSDNATTPVADATAPAPEVEDEARFADTGVSTDTQEQDGVLSDGLATDADEGEGEGDGGETSVTAAAPETVEVELDGKKYAVPKELHGAFLMNADYTRKTQAVAEAAREVEKAREAVEADRKSAMEAVEAEKDAHAKVYSLRATLKAWEGVDWDRLEQLDQENGTQQLASSLRRYQVLKDALVSAEGELTSKTSERQAKEQADQQRREATAADEDAKLLRDGYQHLTLKIPDWPTVAPKVVEFAQTRFGFTPQELAAVRDPRMYEVLHQAFANAQAATRTQQTERIKLAQQVQPAPTIPGKAPPVRDKERMSTAEWIRQRNKDLEAQRKRR